MEKIARANFFSSFVIRASSFFTRRQLFFQPRDFRTRPGQFGFRAATRVALLRQFAREPADFQLRHHMTSEQGQRFFLRSGELPRLHVNDAERPERVAGGRDQRRARVNPTPKIKPA